MTITSFLRKSVFGVSPVRNERDPRMEALFVDIVERFPAFTQNQASIDAEDTLRPSIARKLAKLARDGMINGLGCYVSDVSGTFQKAHSLVRAGQIEEARAQLRALVGRIVSNDSWNNFGEPMHAYYPHYGAQRPQIGLVSSDLNCGVGPDLLDELLRLVVLPANTPSTAAEFEKTCSRWQEDFAAKAREVISFAEEFAADRSSSRFRLFKRRKL